MMLGKYSQGLPVSQQSEDRLAGNDGDGRVHEEDVVIGPSERYPVNGLLCRSEPIKKKGREDDARTKWFLVLTLTRGSPSRSERSTAGYRK